MLLEAHEFLIVPCIASELQSWAFSWELRSLGLFHYAFSLLLTLDWNSWAINLWQTYSLYSLFLFLSLSVLTFDVAQSVFQHHELFFIRTRLWIRDFQTIATGLTFYFKLKRGLWGASFGGILVFQDMFYFRERWFNWGTGGAAWAPSQVHILVRLDLSTYALKLRLLCIHQTFFKCDDLRGFLEERPLWKLLLCQYKIFEFGAKIELLDRRSGLSRKTQAISLINKTGASFKSFFESKTRFRQNF